MLISIGVDAILKLAAFIPFLGWLLVAVAGAFGLGVVILGLLNSKNTQAPIIE